MTERGASSPRSRTGAKWWVTTLIVACGILVLGFIWVGRETSRQLALMAAGIEQIMSGVRVTDEVALAGSLVLRDGDTVGRIKRVVKTSARGDAHPTISVLAAVDTSAATTALSTSASVAWVDSQPVPTRRVIVNILSAAPTGAKRYGQLWFIGQDRVLPLYGP